MITTPDGANTYAERRQSGAKSDDHTQRAVRKQPGGRFNSRHEAKLAVFDYLETFYNPRRRHSALGQISPAVFEA